VQRRLRIVGEARSAKDQDKLIGKIEAEKKAKRKRRGPSVSPAL